MAERYLLTAPQRDLWVAMQIDGGSYNLPMIHSVRGPFDPAAWLRALAAVIARHDVLRSSIEAGSELCQRVHPAADPPFEQYDARGWAPDRVRDLIRERSTASFDLSAPPLMRACAIRTPGNSSSTGIAVSRRNRAAARRNTRSSR